MLICAFLAKTEISVYFKIKLNLREGRIQMNKSNKNIQSLETKKGDICHDPGNTSHIPFSSSSQFSFMSFYAGASHLPPSTPNTQAKTHK